MSAALRSQLRIHPARLDGLLAALDYEPDEDFSLERNVSDCLSDYQWYATGEQDGLLTFAFQSDDDVEMDWEVLLTLSAFLEDGSFYEERAGDYVSDAEGNARSGLIRAWVEGGQLRAMVYALIPTADGQYQRQPVQVLDPRMI